MIKKILKEFKDISDFNLNNEITLFRNLAETITKYSSSFFISETHGLKCLVEFDSITGSREKCEISDLLIVTINKSEEIRVTFWQAKKFKSSKWLTTKLSSNINYFDFKGQFNQWELLSYRPKILKGTKSFTPPQNILSSFESASIGSFGVFYEKNGSIELNYSIAEMISATSLGKHTKLIINEKLTKYFFNKKEVMVANDLNAFLEALYNHQIGSLIDKTKTEHQWLLSYLNSKLKHHHINFSFENDNNYNINYEIDGISTLIINIE